MQHQNDREWWIGGRRMGLDRREYAYFCHIPERRRSGERRCGEERRWPGRLFSRSAPADKAAAAWTMHS